MIKFPLNFCVIGAPKCGTTSLCSWLSSTPGIHFSSPKEPNFFNVDHVDPWRPSEEKYLDWLTPASDGELIGEGSVWYLHSKAAIPRIESCTTECKFVVCLRNPLQMAVSLHQQQLYSGNETITDFNYAWSLSSERRIGNFVPSTCFESALIDYEGACSTGDQLIRLLSTVERSRVHFVFFDELCRNPELVYSQVTKFLEIDGAANLDFSPVNVAKVRPFPRLRRLSKQLGVIKSSFGIDKSFGLLSWMDSLNSKHKKYDISESDLVESLKRFSDDQVNKIENVTLRSLAHWKSVR